jgi:hypothetical protein
MQFFQKLFEWKKWGIAPSDRVLEIGSGGSPMVRSDVLADRYVDSDHERELPIAHDRTLVAADIASLPFRDHSFDFIYTAHVVEHCKEVALCLRELARVGKRGLIIVPGEIYERNYLKESHHWIISVRDNRLVFREKCACTRINPGANHEIWKNMFWRTYAQNRQLLDIHFFWQGTIPFEIVRCGVAGESDSVQTGETPTDLRQRRLSFSHRLRRKTFETCAGFIRRRMR